MNGWMTFFMEVINLLSSCFLDIRYREGSQAETDSFRKITEALSGFERRPGKCGSILIRSRGLGENPTAGADGYELVTRDIAVDTAVTPTMIREAGSRMSFFSGRLSQAFEVFSANNITSIYLKIPWRLPEDMDRLRESLRILSSFNRAAKTDSPVVFTKNGKQITIPQVKDERGRPHPNLTVAMGLNNLDPAKTQDMVNTIDSMVRESGTRKPGTHFIDVYDAMRSSPKFQQLMKPPIEVNNVRWLLANSEAEALSNEKIQVARLAVDFSKDSPHQVAQILTSIYGDDFSRINARVLGERLILITAFFDAIEKEKIEQTISKEIFESILSRFTQVRREVRNDLKLIDKKLHIQSRGVETPMGMIHPEFVKMIRFFRGSPMPKEELFSRTTEAGKNKTIPSTEKTQRSLGAHKDQFEQKSVRPVEEKIVQPSSEMEKLVEARIDQMEHGSLMSAEKSQEARVETQDDLADSKKKAEDIVTPFKRCFDSNGHFQKGSFEKNIPALARHRDQVFEFIWQYLKGTMNRDDRLALLNSLNLLVSRIDQSEKAVSVLLNDIFSQPNKVDISDRNGLMLASLVIRKYNKEFNREIELTPEEVFLVKEGLIGSAVKVASGIIENESKKVMQKHMTVYTGITKSLHMNEAEDVSMPFRYLLNLERETCIFLSLVGGPTPRAVMRNAVKTYGDPESEIYKENGNSSHTTAFLQHLKILVRGLGRIGETEDIPVFEDLMHREQGFMRFGQDPRSQDMIQRVMRWAEDAAKHIASTHETVTA